MDFELVAVLILVFVIGMIIGSVIRNLFIEEDDICGKVCVETGDPDGPYMFLFLDIPVEELVSMDAARFSISVDEMSDKWTR